ncbi:GNAT family N-acetyltransferase [Ferrimonas balearica]|uniref:GNAT family N-acetyltransferase n=1 Tax=Ferrimonas balearica TaxID=44012 RepID=UPI001C992043|nr:GNAT family N-acetyltransferase [Ferrimonas balearica]MBY5991180.1 GNAT family N-acetyltransferase [Ferrimonas balearica]
MNTLPFSTPRLNVGPLTPDPGPTLLMQIPELLSPRATRHLPSGWQGIHTEDASRSWLSERQAEGQLMAVRLRGTDELVGLLMLSNTTRVQTGLTLHLGYVLAERWWGQGLASELVSGLAEWCQMDGRVSALIGGVVRDHAASVKVLEKSGFEPVEVETAPETVQFFERRFTSPPVS